MLLVCARVWGAHRATKRLYVHDFSTVDNYSTARDLSRRARQAASAEREIFGQRRPVLHGAREQEAGDHDHEHADERLNHRELWYFEPGREAWW